MRNLLLAFVALLIATGVGLSAAQDARAIHVDTDYNYEGTGTRTVTLLDIRTNTAVWNADPCPLDICEGRLAVGLKIEVPLNVKIEPGAQFVLDAPDGPMVEGDTIPVKVKLLSKEGHFKMTLDANILLQLGYNENSDGKIGCFGWEDPNPQPGDHCTSYNLLAQLPELPVFDEGMTAAYAGGQNAFQDDAVLAEIPVCQLLIALDICDIRLIGIVGALLEATPAAADGDPAFTTPGYHSQRNLTLGGKAMGESKHIQFTSPDEILDEVKIACGGSAGSVVGYELVDNSYDARLTKFTNGFRIEAVIDLEIAEPTIKIYEKLEVVNWLEVFPGQFGAPIHIFAGAPDAKYALGPYQLETQPPTITLVSGSPGAEEGVPSIFQAAAEDNCPGELSYRWDFSDGGVAFGPATTHTFNDDGPFSYELTVCDLRQNCSTADRQYFVANQDPIANAGPDAGEAWGIAVPFNGQAVDPGADDQATLSYEWDFGDNSPKGHALNVTHAYTTPGTYDATLTVCDKDGACDTDAREVVIRKRNTSTGYLGAHTWTYDTNVFLSASLVDEFGQLVNGRGIDFSIDGANVASGNTNSAGIADRQYQVEQTAGSHSVEAAFGGDSLYETSSSSDQSVVVVKPTNVTYTGALKGGPKKTIALSAILEDSEGKPLAGRTITFQLGDQTATAVTDANGLATTTLKLDQKNGTYSLTTTYETSGPNAGDADKYAASGDVDTFKLQVK